MSTSGSRKARQQHWFFFVAVVLATLVAADQVAVAYYYERVYDAYSALPTVPADAAVVLFSDYTRRGGLDAETRRRLRHGARLFKRGVVHAVLCSGGRRDPDRGGADLMVAALVQMGVPRNRVYSDGESYDTVTNVAHALRMAEAHGWSSLIFVSSPVHLDRVRRLMKGSTIRSSYSAYTADPDATAVRWIEKTWQVHHEWIAWAAYRIIPRPLYTEWIARLRNVPAPGPQ